MHPSGEEASNRFFALVEDTETRELPKTTDAPLLFFPPTYPADILRPGVDDNAPQ
jgi:hypothetical protein